MKEEIKNVYVNEDKATTVVVFQNGDKVKVKRHKDDQNDFEKAIAIAIIKYYFGRDYWIDACDKISVTNKHKKTTQGDTEFDWWAYYNTLREFWKENDLFNFTDPSSEEKIGEFLDYLTAMARYLKVNYKLREDIQLRCAKRFCKTIFECESNEPYDQAFFNSAFTIHCCYSVTIAHDEKNILANNDIQMKKYARDMYKTYIDLFSTKTETAPKKRGRPRKSPTGEKPIETTQATKADATSVPAKRKRGRPRKLSAREELLN